MKPSLPSIRPPRLPDWLSAGISGSFLGSWTGLAQTLLWVLAGWWMAGALWALAALADPSPAARPSTDGLQAEAMPALGRVFGARAGQLVMPRPDEVRVVGLLASAGTGSVTVSIQSGPVRTLLAGETAQDGWQFDGLDAQGRVLLSRYGQQIALPGLAVGRRLPRAE